LCIKGYDYSRKFTGSDQWEHYYCIRNGCKGAVKCLRSEAKFVEKQRHAGHEPMTDAELEVFFFKVYFSFSLLFMILVLRKKYTI